MREDVVGRANVEDTPELDRYYNELGRQESYALWIGNLQLIHILHVRHQHHILRSLTQRANHLIVILMPD